MQKLSVDSLIFSYFYIFSLYTLIFVYFKNEKNHKYFPINKHKLYINIPRSNRFFVFVHLL